MGSLLVYLLSAASPGFFCPSLLACSLLLLPFSFPFFSCFFLFYSLCLLFPFLSVFHVLFLTFLLLVLASCVFAACLVIMRSVESLSALTSKMFKGRLENYIMSAKERLNFYPFYFVGLLDISSRIEVSHYEYHIMGVKSSLGILAKVSASCRGGRRRRRRHVRRDKHNLVKKS